MSRSQLIVINLAVWVILPFTGLLLLRSTLPQVCDVEPVRVLGSDGYTGTRDSHNGCAITILDNDGRLAPDSVYYDNGYTPPPGAGQRKTKLTAAIALILAPPAITLTTVFIYRDRNRTDTSAEARRSRLAELQTGEEPEDWFIEEEPATAED